MAQAMPQRADHGDVAAGLVRLPRPGEAMIGKLGAHGLHNVVQLGVLIAGSAALAGKSTSLRFTMRMFLALNAARASL